VHAAGLYNTHDDGYTRSCQKYDLVSLHNLTSTGGHLLSVPFTSLKSNSCTALNPTHTHTHATYNNYIRPIHTHKTQLPFSLICLNRNTAVTGQHCPAQVPRPTTDSSVKNSTRLTRRPFPVKLTHLIVHCVIKVSIIHEYRIASDQNKKTQEVNNRSRYPRFDINFADSRRINEKYQLPFSLTS
jgi:hypothetical protein